MKEQLQQLGLTPNESEVYLFLLSNGETTTGSIIKETGIVNSRVYASLESLIQEGLVTYTVQTNGKHFEAQDPNHLFEREEIRIQTIKELIPQLKKHQQTTNELTSTAVYEGFSGFRNAFSNIIEDCPEEETIRVLGFSEQTYANESLRTFINNMNLRSAEKRQQLKILLDQDAKKTFGADRQEETYSTVRYMPPGYISPAAIDIFEDYVYMFLWGEDPYVFAIKNARVAESFKTYFDFLWSTAQ